MVSNTGILLTPVDCILITTAATVPRRRRRGAVEAAMSIQFCKDGLEKQAVDGNMPLC
jgi:hypothetical protein